MRKRKKKKKRTDVTVTVKAVACGGKGEAMLAGSNISCMRNTTF
jgi:hypothetical protein